MYTVIKFGADWCQPCQQLQPTWDKFQEDLSGEVLFQSINIDDNPQLRADYHVRTIPTMILIKDRAEVSRRQGGGTLSELKGWLDESRNIQS